MFQDVDCWHESIKNKFNQQQSTIVKEEDELSSSGRLESKPNDILIKLKHLDVSVCLVDCRKDISSTTTITAENEGTTKTTTKTSATRSEVLYTNHPSNSSSIDANENQVNTLISTKGKCHICDLCGKKFKLRGDLNRHVLTHTGERPYSCDHCGYKCAQKGNLTRHIRTHTQGTNHSPVLCV
jgi:predicted RNA-binding Zn-ribbon protein involved in translation (DUF1610 family)